MSTKKQAVLGMVAVVFALSLFVPVLSIAGSLDPSAPPTTGTMKTLDQVQPTWDQVLPANDSTTPDGCNSSRFKCIMGGAAVLDKETGLVWERTPLGVSEPWPTAITLCQQSSAGGRYGWHLPTIEQLASLMDSSVTSSPKLPAGHPFIYAQYSSEYWSATTFFNWTTDGTYTEYKKFVNFNQGYVNHSGKANSRYIWCVRGGQVYDGL